MKKRFTDRIFGLFLVFALIIANASPVIAKQNDKEQDSPWYDSISEMLSAGEYEEGVVIAGIDMSKATRSGDPGSALETKKISLDTEELIYVDPEDAFEQNEYISWLKELKDEAAAKQDDGVCITSIRRSDMTTAQILRLLASDDCIVFAEPNYIMSAESEIDSDTPGADDIVLEKGEPEEEIIDPDNLDTIDTDEIIDPDELDNIEADDTGLDTEESQDMLMNDDGAARDASALQWSSSEIASLHAANKTSDVSVKVPGWPDGSNMDHEIIVAVVDMPVDFSNPDLSDIAYTFSPELKEKLGCDDHGFNAMWGASDGQLTYDANSMHGTHVAGIIGASWDGSGISGVASNVRIISVQNGGGDTYTNLLDTLRGYSFIKEAVENGVDIRIVNNSWGLSQSSKALDAAVTELGRHGVVSVFAAGNKAEDLNAHIDISAMMADNPYTIIVASTTPTGELAESSNYGKSIVTLGAPGAGILSCLPVQNARYIPALASNNKFYEDFEDAEIGESESLPVKICQVEYNSSGDRPIPDPDKPISGTEAVVVSGDSEIGFEGKNALKVPVDLTKLSYGDAGYCALKIDFGDVSELGISAGDKLGFAFGGKEELWTARIFDTSSDSDPGEFFYVMNNRNCWNIYTYTISENIDTGNLSFIVEIIPDGSHEIYLDAIGIGNELQPYGFMSGTSMASPAVAGAAAVLASRHFEELEGLSASDSAARLASFVRSSVRPLASLADKTSTGGIIDLTVDAGNADALEQPGPDMTDLTVNGSEVIITGSDFGNTPGDAAVVKYVAGSNSAVASSVTHWSDGEVVLALEKDFEGIMEVTLTAENGKYDNIRKFISKSSNIYEKDHHIGSGTGEMFEFDEPELSDDPEVLGDFETKGLLFAGNGKLYYMPQMARIENNPALRSLYCYEPDTDSWTVCPSYPSWIKAASGAWFDGKLYVKGTTVETDESGNIPYYDRNGGQETGTVCVYSYTPGDSSWVECSAENVAAEHTLFAAGSKLMLAGVTEDEWWETEDDNYPGPRDYDPASGAGQPLSSIGIYVANPLAGYTGGHVYICEYEYGNIIHVLDDNMEIANESSIAFPGFWHGDKQLNGNDSDAVDASDFSLVPYDDMLILTGPVAEDGSTDTFILNAGEKTFMPFDKRLSDIQVFMPCAAVLDGRLYVIGSSDFEPDKRIFRSTLLPAPEKTDIETASVIIADQIYNGKALTPKLKVILGSTALKSGIDYIASYSKNINVGTASVTITGTGNYKGKAKGSFKIKAASIDKAAVSGILNKTYTGKAVTQKLTVRLSGRTLKNGIEYKISYKNNTNAGKATVTITGKGNYTGTLKKNFTISKAANTISKVNSSYSKTLSYSKKAQTVKKFAPKAKGSPKFSYKITSMKKGAKTIKTGFTVSKTGILKAAKKLGKGTYTVKVKIFAAATANYKAANKTVTIKVRIK